MDPLPPQTRSSPSTRVGRPRGRPGIPGGHHMNVTIPEAAWRELLYREQITGVYRSEIIRRVLCGIECPLLASAPERPPYGSLRGGGEA